MINRLLITRIQKGSSDAGEDCLFLSLSESCATGNKPGKTDKLTFSEAEIE